MSLRKTLRFRVRLQLSQSRCLSLLLAMSGRVFLFLPPRGHEPPPTLRDRLNPNLSLYRHRFPIPRYDKRPELDTSETALIFEILRLPKKENRRARFYEICTHDKHRVQNTVPVVCICYNRTAVVQTEA